LTCGYAFNTNAGDAKTYGPELEVSAKITDNLTANLSGAYTQAYISSPATPAGLSIASGTPINNIPRYTGQASLDYEAPITGGYRGIGRINEAYVGPSHDVGYYAQEIPPYGLLDGRLGIAKDAWSAFLFGTNLANKRAALTIDNTIFAWQQPDLTRVTTNQPRTIGLEFMTKFH
jgi:iron complex outermembrane recepter protein